jgi:aquaporin Z
LIVYEFIVISNYQLIGVPKMKYVYEFIGTFFLVLTVGLAVLAGPATALFAPLAIGSVLAVMVYAGGHISGGHYNPAVSFAVYLRGKLSHVDLVYYWIAQLLAAVVAAYLAIYLTGNKFAATLDLDVVRSLIVEFLFTFALCFVVLNVATAKATTGNSYFGFAIGFIVLVGAYTVGAISSGAFNPAVALGAVILKAVSWKSLWVYILGNLAGGAAAAFTFKAAHPNE